MLDKLAYHLYANRLWDLIGNYQHGSRKSFNTVSRKSFNTVLHTVEVMKHLQISKRGRIKFGTTLFFIDFKGAFD